MGSQMVKAYFVPDPDYDYVDPLPAVAPAGVTKKGRQCGQCGMKFDYDVTYGYNCGHQNCPMSLN